MSTAPGTFTSRDLESAASETFKGESAVGPTHISDSLLRRCLSAVSVRSFQ